MPLNYIADKLLRRKAQSDFAITRRNVFFDINNYERVVNDLTGRLTSSQSQRLAVAQGLGLPTAGLIVGGQVGEVERSGNRKPIAKSATNKANGATNNGLPVSAIGSVGSNSRSRERKRGGQRSGQQDPD